MIAIAAGNETKSIELRLQWSRNTLWLPEGLHMTPIERFSGFSVSTRSRGLKDRNR